MSRATARLFAFVVLLLLGAPVALHLILHDLHHDDEHHGDAQDRDDHTDHQHPIVSSPPPPSPALIESQALAPNVVDPIPAQWTRLASTRRNVIAHGAVRLDNDVGLQPLLSTFLI